MYIHTTYVFVNTCMGKVVWVLGGFVCFGFLNHCLGKEGQGPVTRLETRWHGLAHCRQLWLVFSGGNLS